MRRLREWMGSLHIPEEWGVAALPGVAGAALMLIAVLDPRDGAFSGGRVPAFAAGGLFLLAGLAMFASGFRKVPRANRGLRALGVALVALFAVPPFALGLFLRALPALRREADPAMTWNAAIRAEPASPVCSDVVRVVFDRPFQVPPGWSPFVCIVRPDAPVGHSSTFNYFPPGSTEALVKAPILPGDYEVRLHPHLNAVAARLRITVRPGLAELPEAAPEK